MNQQQQDALIDEVLDLACEQLINEISFKVMVETDGGDRPYSPPTVEDYATCGALVDSSKTVASFASEMPAPVLGTSDSPDMVVGEASSTTSPGFGAQEVLPSLVQEGFQSQAGDLSTSDGDTPRQVPVGPGPEQPPTVLVGGVGIASSIPEMMPADGNAATAALFLQEELTVAAPEEGVSLVIPRVETVAEEIPRVGLKVPATQPEVLGADILKPTTIRRSSRSKAKADEHTEN